MSNSADQNSFTYSMKVNVCEMEKAFDLSLCPAAHFHRVYEAEAAFAIQRPVLKKQS